MKYYLHILPSRRGIDGEGHGNFYRKVTVARDIWNRLGFYVSRSGGRFNEHAFDQFECAEFLPLARQVLDAGRPPEPVGTSRKAVGCVFAIRPERADGPKWFTSEEVDTLRKALDLLEEEQTRGGVVVERTGGGN